MWRREGLVQIEMDDVEVHLAGRGAAQDRVEVRPVVVEQAARVVHELGDVQNVFFEDPKGVRIRQHEGERLRTGRGLERFQVDPTIFRRNLDQVESEHPGGGGVRARDCVEDFPRAVWAAVVDENELVIWRDAVDACAQALMQ